MQTGPIEANHIHLKEDFKRPWVPNVIARKTGGPEKGVLKTGGTGFHSREDERLRAALEQAMLESGCINRFCAK